MAELEYVGLSEFIADAIANGNQTALMQRHFNLRYDERSDEWRIENRFTHTSRTG